MNPEIDLQQNSLFHPLLVEIILEAQDMVGMKFIITSTKREDGGVHDTIPLRALDTRCRDEYIGYEIEARVNSRWKYDPDRVWKKVCMAHAADNGAFHLHWQVHPNTVRVT